jgi:hypothetical protein
LVVVVCWFAACSARAASLVPILGPGDFTSISTAIHNFDDVGVINTPQFTFEGTVQQGLASEFTANNTPSGARGLVELVQPVSNEPLIVQFAAPVSEVGLFFGNDDPAFEAGPFDAYLELFDAAHQSLGVAQVESNVNDFADQYLGARSDTPVKSAAIYYQRPEAKTFAVYIDDLKVGFFVPEPATAAIAFFSVLPALPTFRRRCRDRVPGIKNHPDEFETESVGGSTADVPFSIAGIAFPFKIREALGTAERIRIDRGYRSNGQARLVQMRTGFRRCHQA